MNDRLGDLANSAPSWAMDENGQGDVETGFTENIPVAESSASSGAHGNGHSNGVEAASSSWANDPDDFQLTETPFSSEDNVTKAAQKQHMDAFFDDVSKVQDAIAHIVSTTRRIGEIQEESMLSTSEQKEQVLSDEIRPMIEETNRNAKSTKTLLMVLKEENKTYSDETDKNKTIQDSDLRVRENLCNTLTRKFIDEMKHYQRAQQDYKTTIKKKAERQIKTMKEDATDEEIDQIMKSEGGREELMQQHFLVGGVNDQIKNVYNKVSTKYQDVVLLEQSVAELHQMFLDFALLTEQQGELVDQIEHNVKSAKDYVEDANVNVHGAIEISKKVRKKQCCIMVLVIIIALGVLFGLRILP